MREGERNEKACFIYSGMFCLQEASLEVFFFFLRLCVLSLVFMFTVSFCFCFSAVALFCLVCFSFFFSCLKKKITKHCKCDKIQNTLTLQLHNRVQLECYALSPEWILVSCIAACFAASGPA